MRDRVIEPREHLPPVVLSLLAPADRCNQRCPACIIDRAGEPVTQFGLDPQHYAELIRQFHSARIPIHSVNFQGYEVTLPTSWRYVEASFRFAKSISVRRSFVTNGMLLHRWTHAIKALDPVRISISLDGADALTNDALRGLDGAFSATLTSLRRFLDDAPEFRERLAVLSTLYGGRNEASLQDLMPELLHDLGISRWAVSWELDYVDGRLAPATMKDELVPVLQSLREAAERASIEFHVSDDFGLLDGPTRRKLRSRRPFNPRFVYRVDPLGVIRSERRLQQPWSNDGAQWHPDGPDAPTVAGYWRQLQR